MPINASSVIRRATDIILDTTSIRWQAHELVRWLNDAQREVLILRPDAINRTAPVTLAAGARQNLDALALTPAPIKLIEITRNTAGAKGAITQTQRSMLDAQVPGWYSLPGTLNIQHYTFDPRDPKTFYVFPPALATAQIELMFAGTPTDIAEPAAGALFSDVVGLLTVPDIYANATLDYVLYRVFSKDAEVAGNDARAQSHYAAFTASLAAEISATLAVQPQAKPGRPLGARN